MAKRYVFRLGSRLKSPTSNTPGAFVRTATAIYPNGEREDVKILFKVQPSKPQIDANSVIAKGGLSNQQVIVRNVQNNVDVKLYQANGSVIPNTTSVIANGTATITVQELYQQIIFTLSLLLQLII